MQKKNSDARKTARASEEAAAIWMDPRDLVPWSKNPRDNSESVARVVALIKRFGFGAPVVARAKNREIIAGHTRHLAALELKLPKIPVRLRDLSERDAHLLALADNRSTELTPWSDSLPTLLSELSVPDLNLAGWSETELHKLLGTEDAAPSGESAVFSAEAIADAYADELCGHAFSDYTVRTLGEVMHELNRCALGTASPTVRLADRWFKHRYNVKAGKSPETPNETMRNRAAIRGVVLKLHEMEEQLTLNRFLDFAALYRGRQCARQFPIDVARDLYRKYSKPDGRVLDPCAGWGGRLLGWHCSLLRGSYTGFDASRETVLAHVRMLAELKIPNATVKHGAFEDAQLKRDHYDFAFTSPPYFSTEKYSDDAEQSYVRYTSYADWRSGFLVPLVQHALAALKPGAALALNVADAGEHHIAQDAARIGSEAGATVEHETKLDIGAGGTRLGSSTPREEGVSEDLLILRKK